MLVQVRARQWQEPWRMGGAREEGEGEDIGWRGKRKGRVFVGCKGFWDGEPLGFCICWKRELGI